MKVFSLVLVIGAAAIMATIGAISIFASQSLILGLLPPFLGALAAWIAWTSAIALIIGIQVGECRPLYLSHKHTESKDLYHQGANPASTPPDVKSLLTQLMEELGLSRQKQIWVNLFAIAITIVDFIWSSILFPPFKSDRIKSRCSEQTLGQVKMMTEHPDGVILRGELVPIPSPTPSPTPTLGEGAIVPAPLAVAPTTFPPPSSLVPPAKEEGYLPNGNCICWRYVKNRVPQYPDYYSVQELEQFAFLQAGFVRLNKPEPGAIVLHQPNSFRSGSGSGHIEMVDSVDAQGVPTIATAYSWRTV